ncbi:hypothetical protein [Kitasatospora sp. NPDC097691]|uniref:hypothetical protein n=1 Tax=Kitasatospora sp. NPDC097691 TaxID=3157231 RepID=UPI0033296BE5
MSSSSMAPDTPHQPCVRCARRAHRHSRVKQRLRVTAQAVTGVITAANIGAAVTLLLLGRPDEASACAAVASAGLTTGKALTRDKHEE